MCLVIFSTRVLRYTAFVILNEMIFDASSSLNLKNATYLKAVKQHVWQTYRADIEGGDVTTELFLPKKCPDIRAEIVANEPGVFAGFPEAKWLLKKIGVSITKHIKEGRLFKKGDILLVLHGRADRILKAERTLLNLLQRMSGIATATQKMASHLPKTIKLLATRKTFWGLLDKRAVYVGGGATHRLNLSDAAMIKDNHWMLSPLCHFMLDTESTHPSYNDSNLSRFRIKCGMTKGGAGVTRGGIGITNKLKKLRFIEFEMDNLSQVRQFVEFYSHVPAFLRSSKKVAIMLDNFSPTDVKKAVKLLKLLGIWIEVSGGITLQNIKSYAIRGVDAISSGAITTKAPALDLSLQT
ncbi:hypothetical protein COY07_03310 [Candidatus Peregrinibacteria bacterium CG_4_10_14_0_2_um_filter_43_11]|nr:MAG: hypothetical protein COY07_03310 [Candidatus Peregrinibacteria bacterium CG_4_10_14_0_2_um_filter_43_11]